MLNSPDILNRRLPLLISGIGVVLGFLLVAEAIVEMTRPGLAHEGFLLGVLTSAPFIAAQIYGGYWLKQSELLSNWYPQVVRWWAGFLVGFAVLIVGISLSVQSMNPLRFIGTVRWSAGIGGAVGFIVGVFYARGIQRTVEAEQARRRQQQTQRERDRLDQFASMVSHDLRNPLRVAEGNLELALEDPEKAPIESALVALDRMDDLIEDVLALARQGQPIDEVEEVQLATVVERCWEMVDSAEADFEIEGNLAFLADPDRVQQLIENLFRNAIDHGGRDVSIRVGVLDSGDGFFVADDGPGIPEEDRIQVFESRYTTGESGTGFGLAIVQEIVEAHGWEIEVTASSSGGARVEITGVELIAD